MLCCCSLCLADLCCAAVVCAWLQITFTEGPFLRVSVTATKHQAQEDLETTTPAAAAGKWATPAAAAGAGAGAAGGRINEVAWARREHIPLHQSVTNGFNFVFLAPRPGCAPQVLPYTLQEAREYLAAYRQQQEDVAVARAYVAAAAEGGFSAGLSLVGDASAGLHHSKL